MENMTPQAEQMTENQAAEICTEETKPAKAAKKSPAKKTAAKKPVAKKKTKK